MSKLITGEREKGTYDAAVAIEVQAAEGFSRAEKLLAGISAGANKAVGSAMKRAANAGKTYIKKAVTQTYAINQSTFLKRTKNINNIVRTSNGGIVVNFGYKGYTLSLMEFNTSVNKAGLVTTQVKKASARKALDHAFLAEMGKNKTIGVYERVSKERFPVRKFFGPATPQMIYYTLGEKGVSEKDFDRTIRETFEERIDHEILRVLNGWG